LELQLEGERQVWLLLSPLALVGAHVLEISLKLLLEQEERLMVEVVVQAEREVSHGQMQGEEQGQDLDTKTRTLKASHTGGTTLSYRRSPGLQNHTEHLSSSMLVCLANPAEAIEEREGAHSASHRGRKMSRESREDSDRIDANPSLP
jgi:hypothetical protein